MLSSELDRAKRALYLAQDRIVELTKTQLALSGTLGQLTEQASTDPLTGLSNRRHFMEGLKATFQAARSRDLPFSVVMLDIDSFKSYNDSFGHAEGDKVIWIVAKLLLRNTGGDHIVARYGGEEFAILLPAADASLASELAERHRAAIALLSLAVSTGLGELRDIDAGSDDSATRHDARGSGSRPLPLQEPRAESRDASSRHRNPSPGSSRARAPVIAPRRS